MHTILKSLYNNGDNDGDMIVKTKDRDVRCHSFILRYVSEFMRINVMSNFNIIDMETSSDLINIVFTYLYSEKIIDRDLSATDIIQLFDLISQLKCHTSVCILKNHYLQKFPSLINDDNWMELLKYTYNISKYSELQEEIVTYYTGNILNNIEMYNSQTLTDSYKNLNEEIKNLLFSICIKKINELTIELKNSTTENENKQKQAINEYLKTIEVECDDEPEEAEEEVKEVKTSPKLTSSKSTKMVHKVIKK